MKRKNLFVRSGIKQIVATATAVAMTASMVVAVPAANAASGINTVTTDSAVTASVTPASQTAIQMLGMSCLEDPSLKGASLIDLNNWYGSGQAGSLRYILDGTAEYSASVDPYVVNTINSATPSCVFYATHIGAKSFNTGIKQPKSALAEIGVNANADAVWKQLPDVLVGTWVTTDGTQTNYKDSYNNSVNIINGTATKEGVEAFGDGKYDPQAVNYDSDTMATIINSTYSIAKAAKAVVTNSNGAKKLRFGDADSAVEIATTFEEFIKGSQGYVLYCLNKDGKEKKTVAIVNAVEDTDNGAVFKLTQPLTTVDSAKENRAVESIKNVCNVMAGDENHQATLSDLEKKADFILIDPATGAGANQTAIVEKMPNLKDKTYWITSDKGIAAGTTYNFTANNTEIGQNYARLIACAYPEYLDQSDMVAFWYDKFLHVKTDKLGEVISKAMSGVRNWDNQNDYTTWTSSTVADYKAADVQSKIETGCAYLQTWSADQFTDQAELLKLTENVPALKLPAVEQSISLKAAKTSTYQSTSAQSIKLTVSGAKTAVSFKSSNSSIAVKNGYVVIPAKFAGKFTVTAVAAGTEDYKTASASVSINVVAQKANTMTAKAKKSKFKKNKKKAQTTKIIVSKAQGKVTFKSNKKAVKVSKTGKITIKKGFKGTAKITVKAAGNTVYKPGTKTVKIVVK